MSRFFMFVMVLCAPAVAGAESSAHVEDDGLVVLRDCVEKFDAAPMNHRLVGAAEEALDRCLLVAEVALEAEMRLIKSFRSAVPPIEAGREGLVRMEAVLSSFALEGMAVAEASSAIESLRKWGPRWLEEDPIARLRVAVGSLEAAREVLSLP